MQVLTGINEGLRVVEHTPRHACSLNPDDGEVLTNLAEVFGRDDPSFTIVH